MTQRFLKFLLAAIAASALAAPAANAATKTESATAGNVTASVTWTQTVSKGARNVRVSISRGGTELVSDQAIEPKCRAFCGVPSGDEPIRIRDLNDDAE